MVSEETENQLKKHGLEITNIVATLELSNEFDLYEINQDINHSEYDPEMMPFLIYRPNGDSGVSCLLPTNGVLSIAGAANHPELIQTAEKFISELQEIGINIQETPDELNIKNIVFIGDMETDVVLDRLILDIGFEVSEYEPEQFPGLIYKHNDEATVLIFGTGKILITGTTSYQIAIDAYNFISDQIL